MKKVMVCMIACLIVFAEGLSSPMALAGMKKATFNVSAKKLFSVALKNVRFSGKFGTTSMPNSDADKLTFIFTSGGDEKPYDCLRKGQTRDFIGCMTYTVTAIPEGPSKSVLEVETKYIDAASIETGFILKAQKEEDAAEEFISKVRGDL